MIGVDVESSPIYHSECILRENEHEFEASLSHWGADYNDPMTFLDMFVTNAEFNQVGYSNKKYDELIANASVEHDSEKRVNMFVQAEKLLMADMPIAPLYFRNRLYLRSSEIQGMFQPSYGFEWELKWASIQK